jgi:hypothetical protein
MARVLICVMALLTGCAGQRPVRAPDGGADGPRVTVAATLPARIPDRPGWTRDIAAAFIALGIETTRANVCAVVAIIEQESGFQVDPPVPKLPAIAWREIDERAANAAVPRAIVHGVLGLTSRDGRSYAERIDQVRTEKDLSDIFEDFIAAVPLGRTLFADRNPIRTRGPMQVHVAFAQEFAQRRRYPYPVKKSLADEVFTRRGGVYFGVAHLLDYEAPYDSPLFRFADFNAGQYASRNAAFQAAVRTASGVALIADGALLPHDGSLGNTEAALRTIAGRLRLDESAIHEALLQSKGPEFATTVLYRRVFELASSRTGHSPPRAIVPRIELHSPKITRPLTTAWYAQRVDARFERCLQR